MMLRNAALQSKKLVFARGGALRSLATRATVASSSSTEAVAKCPFTGATSSKKRDHSTIEFAAESTSVPELKDVPNVPVLGSFIHAVPLIGPYLNKNFYHVPEMMADNAFEFQYQMYEKFGRFYTTYIPGLGEGLYPKVYMVMDPDEMKKVLRQEGAYPRGGVESLQPMVKWMKKQNFSISGNAKENSPEQNGFLGRGEGWKKVRTFLQTDLLSPKSAAGYVPGVGKAAQIASQGAKSHKHDLNTFFNYAAFDMFQTVFFGQLSKLSDPNTLSNPTDVEFCQLAVDSLAYLIQMANDKQQAILFNMGIETQVYKDFEAAMDGLKDTVNDKLHTFKERWERGDLDEFEKNSYFAHALERQQQSDGEFGMKELMEVALIMLNASVDTTATFIAWAMVHLSVNPDVQEQLYQEVKANFDKNGGQFTSDTFSKANSPYLNAFLRESHRVTPVFPTVLFKSNIGAEIELHGETIPKDSIIGFDSFSLGMDPKVVDEPERFRPERWLDPREIAARKGTAAEALDSVFFRDPFSQGARKCPGSRVAVNETQLILAQMVLDWKVTAPESVQTYKDIPYKMQTLLVPQLPEMNMEARA